MTKHYVTDALALIGSGMCELQGRGVQTMLLSNPDGITVELSSCRRRMSTLSVNILNSDAGAKLSFLEGVLERLRDGDPSEVIGSAEREYESRYVF